MSGVDRRGFLLILAGAAGVLGVDRVMNSGGSPDPPDHAVWIAIETWMKGHAPEALEVLRPGAAEGSIRDAEEILALDLPQSFRRSVARHDGEEVRWPTLVGHGYLMSLQEIVDHESDLSEWFKRSSDPEGRWWRPGLVPFVSRDGDYLCMDLAPPKGRRRGEVCALLHDSDPTFSRIAPSFDSWLRRWAKELEAGVFYLDRAPGGGLVPRDGARSRIWPE